MKIKNKQQNKKKTNKNRIMNEFLRYSEALKEVIRNKNT